MHCLRKRYTCFDSEISISPKPNEFPISDFHFLLHSALNSCNHPHSLLISAIYILLFNSCNLRFSHLIFLSFTFPANFTFRNSHLNLDSAQLEHTSNPNCSLNQSLWDSTSLYCEFLLDDNRCTCRKEFCRSCNFLNCSITSCASSLWRRCRGLVFD